MLKNIKDRNEEANDIDFETNKTSWRGTTQSITQVTGYNQKKKTLIRDAFCIKHYNILRDFYQIYIW